MRKTCNLAEAAEFFKSNDCFGILTHQFPTAILLVLLTACAVCFSKWAKRQECL